MAVSLNLLSAFNSTKWQVTYENVSRSSFPNVRKSTSLCGTYCTTRGIAKERRRGLSLSLAATGSNQVDTNTNEKGSEITGRTLSNDNSSALSQSPSNASSENGISQLNVNNESSSQLSEASNGQVLSSVQNPDTSSSPDPQSTKKSPLTARERLRAARVLSRYNESKTSKSDMGSKVLEAIRESDRGKKRSRLPEAPINLFDDSKRGMPKPGWTFQFPGGSDLFFIVFSFVFISTVMFATTYIVWKVGGIHFNEY
ncbi:hypothetical protein IC582_024239 [Cucumis melo]|uniref:Uncharacterized protein LOC103495120 isoform X1 n=1 Tax=Cucumis melo TaxID=3656 RepID=A0A1S3BYZ3_CUCME|nr:uncharacterized protein LOC103495120 isoform X1 [Cucumis melo]